MFFEYETKRLTLKILDSSYASRVLEFYSDNIEYFNPVEPKRSPEFYTRKYQKALLDMEYNGFLQGKHIRFYIFEKGDTSKIIGSISFNNILRGDFLSALLGYKIHHDYTQKGYAYEAISKAIDIMFNECGLNRIEAYILPTNTPSIKLIEKLQFTPEGIAHSYVRLNDKWEDHLRYSLVNSKHQ